MIWLRRLQTGLNDVATITTRMVESNKFFLFIVGIFVFQAVWIAISGKFSMAYDEYFHLGVIREYANQWLPWLKNVPAETAQFGAVSRDPSFLYHYLMSFPYRIFAAVFRSDMVQIIFLRLVSVAMFTAGLFVYRRLLLGAGLGKKLTHLVLFFFTLVPSFVMLAAQINYDNAAFLLTGLMLLFASKLVAEIRRGHVEVKDLLLFLTLLMASGMTKYALLPIVGATAIFVLLYSIRYRSKLRLVTVAHQFLHEKRRVMVVTTCLLFVLTGLLFANRIGMNVVRYHTPAPSCDQVLSDAECRLFDPYRRDAEYQGWGLQDKITIEDRKNYPSHWYTHMLWESFFVVGSRELLYTPRDPLPSGYFAGKVLLALSIIIVVVHAVWLWRKNAHFQLFIVVIAAYIGALYWRNYHDYLRTGIPVAIHARYVVFLMPLLGAMAAVGLRRSVPKSWRWPVGLFFVLMVSFLIFGGGWLPFVLRSWDEWMWPQMIEANKILRHILWQFIPLD